MDSPWPSLGRDRLTAVATGAAAVVALGGSGVATAYDRSGTFGFANALVIACAIGTVAVVGAVITLAIPGNRVG